MPDLTRKQREFALREQKILQVARPMVLADGYHGLSMDRIAERMEYSKGTIYNHFPCKEEIILALAVQTLSKRTVLFERAAAYVGNARERMQAVGVAAELFARLHWDHFHLENMVRTPSIWDKTSLQRRQQLESSENRCISIVAEIVHQAISVRELKLPAHMNAAEFVFGLWSIYYGSYALIATHHNLEHLGVSRCYESVAEHTARLVDGYGWKPLSSEYNYGAVVSQLLVEVFGPEMKRLEKVAGAILNGN